MHRIVFILFFLLRASFIYANDTLKIMSIIPMKARLMTVDELGNVYVVRENNSLVRFTETGDSSAFYRSVKNGDIGTVDATNPLRIIVYYPQYHKVVLLDRMMAQKNELDLRKLNIFTTSVVAASADGNLWVYDPFNARLKKINEQLQEVGQSNDIRQEAQIVPSPVFMIERDLKIFLCDTIRGIFSFDRYGNYINTISVFGVKYLQVFGSQLIYRHEDSLLSWDIGKAVSSVLIIPHKEDKIINAAIVRNVLYVLYQDRLVLYNLRNEN